MMKIGLFGGSFNPIHTGHLILAQEAQYQYQLDKVIFIPAANPPHKDPSELIDSRHRYRMVELAIEQNPDFEISDIELQRQGKSYTIETLKTYQHNYAGKAEIFLLAGMDALAEIFTWKDAENLINLCWFIGGPRRGYSLDKLDNRLIGKVKPLDMPMIEIASRTIRGRISKGIPVRYWVPDSVYRYLSEHNLYQKQEFTIK